MSLLVVGGWDPQRHAGVGVDLQTADALGLRTAAVLTCNTCQDGDRAIVEPTPLPLLTCNTCQDGDRAIVEPTPLPLFEAQLEASDPDVVKVGLVATREHADALVRWLDRRPRRVVLDPVLRASSGANLWRDDGVEALAELIARAELVTPNLDEAEALCGTRDAEDAARLLRARGARAVLVKGGHRAGELVRDCFVGDEVTWLEGERRADARGTGCTLATAIACAMTWPIDSLLDAVVVGSGHGRRRLREGRHAPWPVEACDLPRIGPSLAEGFAPAPSIGFYPLVARAVDVAVVAQLGVTMVQLRAKDLEGPTLAREVRAAVEATRGTRCRLVVNDSISLALDEGAWGVHLGQEDFAATPRARLEEAQRRGLGLGISTHTYAELARALAVKPSYVALGPIWPTALKPMRYPPQGPERVAEWRRLAGVPVVAIGGVTPERVALLRAADGICVLSDLTGRVATRAREYLT